MGGNPSFKLDGELHRAVISLGEERSLISRDLKLTMAG